MVDKAMHEKMSALARLGAKASNGGETRRLQNLVKKGLKTNIPTSGNLADILYKVGVDANEKVDAARGIISVFIFKALAGDLSAARFIFEAGGLTLNAAEKRARIAAISKMAENPQRVEVRDIQAVSPVEMRAEAVQLGIFEGDAFNKGAAEA